MFFKIYRKISQISQENTCVEVYFLIKLQASGCFIKKETPTHVFSCEIWDIFKNTFFYRIPLVTASVNTMLGFSKYGNLDKDKTISA